MARIEIAPLPMELGLNREQYEELAAELRRDGHLVEIVESTEYRSDPSISAASTEPIDLTIRVLGSGITALSLANKARRTLRARKRRYGRGKRQAVIDLPGDKTHRFDIPER